MKTHDLVQGTPQWHAHRATHYNASDAPAMMGCSPYKTRTQLLHEIHTGLTPEVDAATQRRFDDGHRFEALARPLAEAIIGEELYPVVGSVDEYSASFDGLTMDESTAFEHKSLNDDLRDVLHADCKGHELPLQYKVQMEQQCMVAQCSRILFMASKWEGDTLVEERHCWYYSDAALRAKIGQGWAQFKSDLAAYVPEVTLVEAVGYTPETLPALHIEVTGMVTASNLQEYKTHALAVFSGINRQLLTDQDFATAEKTVKWCKDVEDRIIAAKQHALGQTASIDALFRAMDDIATESRRTRLELDKLVSARKISIREDINREGVNEFRQHLDGLNARLGKPYMPEVPNKFLESMRSKRTVSALRDAVATELARLKIESNAIADKIQINLNTLRDVAADHAFLFADTRTIVLKPCDDLAVLVKSRIAEHQAAEAAKEEATRARIRAEEQAKAERVVRAKLADEQAKAALAERDRIAEEAAKVERVVTAPDVAPISHQTAVVEAPKPPQIIPKNIPKTTRPTDDAIIEILALNYRVHESKVIEWLLAMDLQSASDRMLVDF